MLYSPELHETLVEHPWDADAVRAEIRAIVEDCEVALDPSGYWPLHPLDEDPDEDDDRFATIYLGSAGVLLALDLLARRGLADARDHAALLEQLAEDYRAQPEFAAFAHAPSFWMGEAGILHVLHRVAPSTGVADRLAELVSANEEDTHREFMWGSPGTMLVARELGRTDLWQKSAQALLAACEPSGLWTQHLYGMETQFLGPAHGFAGCVAALAHEPDDELHRRASETFKRHAVEEDGFANWPPVAGEGLVTRQGTIRLQWCHGAPGMVASLAQIAPGDDEHERLLLAGGALTWHAGPLVKGANLCHGTAGSGLAFLKLFERTGDEQWLARARAFAMHAVAQVDEARRTLGRGRYSLWTGDPGTALYLALCLEGSSQLPSFDANDFAAAP